MIRIATKRTFVGVSASGLAKYIKEREADELRETEGRELFNNEKTFSVLEEAIDWVSGESNDDFYHFIISLEEQDFDQLGDTQEEKVTNFQVALENGLRDWSEISTNGKAKWVAGIHLNTNYPHAHFLLSKAGIRGNLHTRMFADQGQNSILSFVKVHFEKRISEQSDFLTVTLNLSDGSPRIKVYNPLVFDTVKIEAGNAPARKVLKSVGATIIPNVPNTWILPLSQFEKHRKEIERSGCLVSLPPEVPPDAIKSGYFLEVALSSSKTFSEQFGIYRHFADPLLWLVDSKQETFPTAFISREALSAGLRTGVLKLVREDGTPKEIYHFEKSDFDPFRDRMLIGKSESVKLELQLAHSQLSIIEDRTSPQFFNVLQKRNALFQEADRFSPDSDSARRRLMAKRLEPDPIFNLDDLNRLQERSFFYGESDAFLKIEGYRATLEKYGLPPFQDLEDGTFFNFSKPFANESDQYEILHPDKTARPYWQSGYIGRIHAQDLLIKMQISDLIVLKADFLERARFFSFDVSLDGYENRVSLDQLERDRRKTLFQVEFEKRRIQRSFKHSGDQKQFEGKDFGSKDGGTKSATQISSSFIEHKSKELLVLQRGIEIVSARILKEERKIDEKLKNAILIQESLNRLKEKCPAEAPTLSRLELENLERVSLHNADSGLFERVEAEFNRVRQFVHNPKSIAAWEGRNAALGFLLDLELAQAKHFLLDHQRNRKIRKFTVSDDSGVLRTASIREVERRIDSNSVSRNLWGDREERIRLKEKLELKADEIEVGLLNRVESIQSIKKQSGLDSVFQTKPYFTEEEFQWVERTLIQMSQPFNEINSNPGSIMNLTRLFTIDDPIFISEDLNRYRLHASEIFSTTDNPELVHYWSVANNAREEERVGPHPVFLPFDVSGVEEGRHQKENLDYQYISNSIREGYFDSLISSLKFPEMQFKAIQMAAEATGVALPTESGLFQRLSNLLEQNASQGLSASEIRLLAVDVGIIQDRPPQVLPFEPGSDDFSLIMAAKENRSTLRAAIASFSSPESQLRALLTLEAAHPLVENLQKRILVGNRLTAPLTETEIQRFALGVLPPNISSLEDPSRRETIQKLTESELKKLLAEIGPEEKLRVLKTISDGIALPEHVETVLKKFETRIFLQGDLAKDLNQSQSWLIIEAALNRQSHLGSDQDFIHPTDEYWPGPSPENSLSDNDQRMTPSLESGRVVASGAIDPSATASARVSSTKDYPKMERFTFEIGFAENGENIFAGISFQDAPFVIAGKKGEVIREVDREIRGIVGDSGAEIRILTDRKAHLAISDDGAFLSGLKTEVILAGKNNGQQIAEQALKGGFDRIRFVGETEVQESLKTSGKYPVAWSPGEKNSLIEKSLYNFTQKAETGVTISLQNTPFAAMFPEVDLRFGEFTKKFKELDPRVQQLAKEKYRGESDEQLEVRLRDSIKNAISKDDARAFHIVNSTKDGTVAFLNEPDRFLVNHLSEGRAKAATMSYFPLLMTQCTKVVQSNLTVMFVNDEAYLEKTPGGEMVARQVAPDGAGLSNLGCYDCGGIASPAFLEKIGVNPLGASQIRLFVHTGEFNELGYEKLIAAKGTIQKPVYQSQEIPAGVDIVLPISSVKSEVKPELGVPMQVRTTFGLVQESPDALRPNVSAGNMVYFLPPEVVEDLKERTTSQAIALQAEKDPGVYLRKIAKNTEFDPESQTFKVEGKTDRFLGLVASYDRKGILDSHPRIAAKVEETVRAKEIGNALGNALSDDARRVMMVPDLTLGDKEICVPQLPEGEYVGGRYPFRGPQDVVIYTNIHKPEYAGRNVAAIHPDTAIRYSASDFDGDQLVLIPASAIPNAVERMRTQEYQQSLPVIEDDLTKTKKKRVDPITNGAVAELALQKMDNAVGMLTERMLSVMGTGDRELIQKHLPRIGQALQASVDAMKHDVTPDLTVLEETRSIPQLEHRRREFRENGSDNPNEVLPVKNAKGNLDMGHVPRLIVIANEHTTEKINPKIGVERFRDLFPPVSNRLLNEKVQVFAKWYGQEVSAHRTRDEALTHFHEKVLPERFQRDFKNEDPDQVTAAYWRHLHNQSEKEGYARSLGGILNIPVLADSLARRLETIDPTPSKIAFQRLAENTPEILTLGEIGEIVRTNFEVRLENHEKFGWVPVGYANGIMLGVANSQDGFVLPGTYQGNLEIRESQRGVYIRANELERTTPYEDRRLSALEGRSEQQILLNELNRIPVVEVAEAVGFSRGEGEWSATWTRGTERLSVTPSNRLGDEFRNRWYLNGEQGDGTVAFLAAAEGISRREAIGFLKESFPERVQAVHEEIAGWKKGLEITLRSGLVSDQSPRGKDVERFISLSGWDPDITARQIEDRAIRIHPLGNDFRVKLDGDRQEYALTQEGWNQIKPENRIFPPRAVEYEILGTMEGKGEILLTDSGPRAYAFLSENPETPRLAVLVESEKILSKEFLGQISEIVEPERIVINHRTLGTDLPLSGVPVITEMPWSAPVATEPVKTTFQRAFEPVPGSGPYAFPPTDDPETIRHLAGLVGGRTVGGGVIIVPEEASDRIIHQHNGEWKELKAPDLKWNRSGRDAIAVLDFTAGENPTRIEVRLTAGGNLKAIDKAPSGSMGEDRNVTSIASDPIGENVASNGLRHVKQSGDEKQPFINTGQALYLHENREWKSVGPDSLTWIDAPGGNRIALLNLRFESRETGLTAVQKPNGEIDFAPAKEHIAEGRIDRAWFTQAIKDQAPNRIELEALPKPNPAVEPNRVDFGGDQGLKVLIVADEAQNARFLADHPELVTSRKRGEVLVADANLKDNLAEAITRGHTRLVWAVTPETFTPEQKKEFQAGFEFHQDQGHRLAEIQSTKWADRHAFEAKVTPTDFAPEINRAPLEKILASLNYREVYREENLVEWGLRSERVIVVEGKEAIIQTGPNEGFSVPQGNGADLIVLLGGKNPANAFDRAQTAQALKESGHSLERPQIPVIPSPAQNTEDLTFQYLRLNGLSIELARREAQQGQVIRFVEIEKDVLRPAFLERDLETRQIKGVTIMTDREAHRTFPVDHVYVTARANLTGQTGERTIILVEKPEEVLAAVTNPSLVFAQGAKLEVIAVPNDQPPPDRYIQSFKEKEQVWAIDARSENAQRLNPSVAVNGYMEKNLIGEACEAQRWREYGRQEMTDILKIDPAVTNDLREAGVVGVNLKNELVVLKTDKMTKEGLERGIGWIGTGMGETPRTLVVAGTDEVALKMAGQYMKANRDAIITTFNSSGNPPSMIMREFSSKGVEVKVVLDQKQSELAPGIQRDLKVVPTIEGQSQKPKKTDNPNKQSHSPKIG